MPLAIRGLEQSLLEVLCQMLESIAQLQAAKKVFLATMTLNQGIFV
eukprot:CAMPEP_0176453564 /NCGR_PEP_ID=MMETSP0127-20121128/29310_1 /TAXON_ID=938130 /ORGANISM="Platyophrya macrostoma, Strain WH" /LENGTH=45 /DNA_ID= /DNA_START= /DNA_END= /DNA_ORIENTATION=